jgi:HK97 family phage major capsid protein
VLTKYSNELNEDAVLNIGDDLAGEIAYAFALKEDQCGFTGDGTSAFGGIVGVVNALKNLDPSPPNIAGLVVSSGSGYATSYNSIVLSDFNKVVATLPEYADVPGEAKWYVSKFFWGSVMQKLATAAGGNSVADLNAGALEKSFLGYPVVVSQVMPKVSATNQICALFGNLRLGSRLGDRRLTTISMSEHALNAFEQDEIVIRGTERFDIVVHDVGNNAGTAGPIVGLITGAS